MRNFVLILLLFLASCAKESTEITVLQFNVWHEGTIVEGGYEGIVDEIIRSDADFVAMSEVRNYDGKAFSERIVKSLKERGATYYSFKSYDSGLLSRHPIVDSVAVFEIDGDRGSAYKLVSSVDGTPVSVYTAHLDYRNCAYYDVKGYDGSTWAERTPERSVDVIQEINHRSMRDDAMRAIVADAKRDIANGHIVFVAGDFNEPSHLDWTVESGDMFDRGGLIVPWPVSTILEEAGYKDSYRELYPDPVTHPGITYPTDCNVDVKKLSWSPKADERERIDFIHYYDDSRLTLISSTLVGTDVEVVRGQRAPMSTQDPLLLPVSTWPSDHKGVLSTFRLE